MIRSFGHASSSWRRVWLTLAVLALAMKVLVPAGFMPTTGSQLGLVICTGQGPLSLDSADHGGVPDSPDPAKSPHHSPCAFAGHGGGAPAPNLVDAVQVVFVAYTPVEPRRLTDLAPGRGLSAPPLPARGPPIQLI